MRRKMLKALSLVLGGLICTNAHGQSDDPRAEEYGIPAPEPPPVLPEYGILEPVPLEPPTAPPPPVVVQGVVVRQADGKPIPGIKVTLGEAAMQTDAEGRFSFTLPGPGEPGAEIEICAEDVDGAEGGGRFKSGLGGFTLTEAGEAPADDVVIDLPRK
jgi:hypothetical protein